MFSFLWAKNAPAPPKVQQAPKIVSNDAPGKKTNPPSPIFALLIAIDKYEAIDDLQACVSDATRLENYLKVDLSVPSSRIQKLLDNDATRTSIQDHILGLAKNDDIRRGDPILIYFAGRGSLVSPPPSWCKPSGSKKTKVKMILPHDFDPGRTEDEEFKEGIPEFVLRKMLTQLAAAKGNNVTMVFDSCYAVSDANIDVATSTGLVARGKDLPNDYTIFDTINADIGPDQAQNFFANESEDTETRILLSPPISSQEANQGFFVKAVASLLDHSILDEAAYRQVALPDQQDEDSEDANKSRFTFDGTDGAAQPASYCIRRRGDKTVLCVEEAETVEERSNMDVVPDESISIQPKGITLALDTRRFESLLYLDNSEGNLTNVHTLWVIQCRTASGPDVRISAPSTSPFTEFFPSNKIPKELDGHGDILLVEEADADLRLRLEEEEEGNSQVVFELTHRVCQAYGLARLHDSVPAGVQDTYKVLEGATSFYHHLKHRISDKALAQFVTIECTRLVKVPREGLKPRGNNLINEGVVLVNLKDNESGNYGLRVTNTSDLPVYVAVFYFNMGDLSIEPLYLPTRADGTQVPLRAQGGQLIIGSQSPWNPLQFELPTLRNGDLAAVDIGCVKAYISTEYFDHSHIQQSSPFETDQCPVKKRQPDTSATFDTAEFAVVLREKGDDESGSDGRGGTTILQNIGSKIKTNQGK